MYMNKELGWHIAETEFVTRRPRFKSSRSWATCRNKTCLILTSSTPSFANDNASVRFETTGFDEDISLRFLSVEETEKESDAVEHPNNRLLIDRMGTALEQKDYVSVLHASANIFEALAELACRM